MFGDIIQPTHLLFILVVALLVLGPKRLPEVGRSLGRGLRDFRQGMQGVEAEAKSIFSDPSRLSDGDAGGSGRGGCADSRPQGRHASSRRCGARSSRGDGSCHRARSSRLRRLTAKPLPLETAALVALLREGGRAWARYVVAARRSGAARLSALAVLEQELGLLSYEALAAAERELAGWQARGYEVLSLSHPDYPDNLRVVENRPPLLFVAGRLSPADRRSVAVIGTRKPSADGNGPGSRGRAGACSCRLHGLLGPGGWDRR